MSYPAIQVEHLSKEYRIGARQEEYGTLRDTLARTATAILNGRKPQTRENIFQALKDISFSVPPGQVIGIVGRNGAGKSTLLKVLSRITEPTTGRIRIRGRVASLLEVGTGFHGELTGRENLYLNGAILGMSQRQIQRNFDEIVAFAEVEKFIDTPVKRYSSGMYLRLAFAVAAHLDPEILIVDEVLAVGDAAFQSKCLGKMEQVASTGRTVLFVSHNMATVRALCQRCLWMHQGQLADDGPTSLILERYLQAPDSQAHSFDLTVHSGRDQKGRSNALRQVTLANGQGEPTRSFVTGDSILFRIDLELNTPLRHPRALIQVNSSLGEPLFMVSSDLQQKQLPSVSGQFTLECRIDELALRPGKYTFNLLFGNSVQLTEAVENIGPFEITEGDFFGVGRIPLAKHGPFLVRSHWNGYEESDRNTVG